MISIFFLVYVTFEFFSHIFMMPFNLRSLTSVDSVIRTGLPQVISAMVTNLLLISTTNLSPYLILEGSTDSNHNHSHQFNTTSLAWFGYVNMAIVPIGGIISGFVTNAIGTKYSLQGALGILIFLRLMSMFFKEAWHVYMVIILTNFCSEFFKGPVFSHLAESAEPHLRTSLSASASSSMVFGQFQQILMATFLPPKITTYINCALPCICIFLLIIVPETPHALISKNKLQEALKSLAWYRGWVKVEVVEPEFQKLLAYHREEEEMRKKEEEEEEKRKSKEFDAVDVPNSDKDLPSTSCDLKNDTPNEVVNSVSSESSRVGILKGTIINGESGRLDALKKISTSESSPLNVFKSITSKATNKIGSLKNKIKKEEEKEEQEKSEVKEYGTVDVPNGDKEVPSTSCDLKNDTPNEVLNSVASESSRVGLLKGTIVNGESGRLAALKKITTSESSPLNVFKNVTSKASNKISLLKNKMKKEEEKEEQEKSEVTETGVVDEPKNDKELLSTSCDLKNDSPNEVLTSVTSESSRVGLLKGTIINGESGRLAALKKISTSKANPLGALKNVTSGATSQLGSLKNAVGGESSVIGSVKDKVPIHLLEQGFNTVKNVRIFTKQSFVLPLALVTFTYFLVYFTGSTVLLNQPEKILNTLHSPLEPKYAAVVLAGANVVGATISVMVIKVCGKRLIMFISLIGMTVCSSSVSLYAYLAGVHYGGNIHNLTESAVLTTVPSLNAYNWIPLIILFLLCIISNFGLSNLPWVLVGELFSKNTRAVGTGIASGITSLLNSFCNASLETLLIILGFSGLYGFYAGVSAAGLIILNFILPDTEGKSLDEIEKYFDNIPLFGYISRYFNCIVNIFRQVKIKCLGNSSNNKEKEELICDK